jgi:hypothetical protein
MFKSTQQTDMNTQALQISAVHRTFNNFFMSEVQRMNNESYGLKTYTKLWIIIRMSRHYWPQLWHIL